MTAAEMNGECGVDQRLDPEQAAQGMLVRHPIYGPGVVVSLSGTGQRRTARIRFVSNADDVKSFRLAFTPLQLMQAPSS
jgi:hypothetical protein